MQSHHSCYQLFHEAALGAHRSISMLSVGVKLNSGISCEVGTGLDVFICLGPAPVGPAVAEILPDKGWKAREQNVGSSAHVWFIIIPLHKRFVL